MKAAFLLFFVFKFDVLGTFGGDCCHLKNRPTKTSLSCMYTIIKAESDVLEASVIEHDDLVISFQ